MKKFGIILLLLLSVAGAFDCIMAGNVNGAAERSMPAERKPAAEDVPYVAIDAGTTSGITTREKYVVKDEAQWLALWQKHTSASITSLPAPRVDFSSEMVIAVFAGEHHKPGCSIQIDGIKKTDSQVIVLVSETGPGAGTSRELNPFGDSQPYYIARAANSSLPVSFQGM